MTIPHPEWISLPKPKFSKSGEKRGYLHIQAIWTLLFSTHCLAFVGGLDVSFLGKGARAIPAPYFGLKHLCSPLGANQLRV